MFNRQLIWKASDMKTMTTSTRGCASYKVTTLDENVAEVEMEVEAVEELTLLGTKVPQNGNP